MATYMIENTKSGVVFGEYEATSEADALDVMSRDAGYRDFAAACDVAPVAAGELVVTKITG